MLVSMHEIIPISFSGSSRKERTFLFISFPPSLPPSPPPSASYCEVLTEPSGRSKGCGIVEYNSPEEVREGGRERGREGGENMGRLT